MQLTRILDRSTHIAALAIAAALLAACATPAQKSSSAQSGGEPHPIVIESRIVTHAVQFADGGTSIAAANQPQLDSLLADFMRAGGGVLEIAVASDPGNDQQAELRRETVRRHVLRRGVRPHELRFSQLRASTGRSGTVVVSYEHFVAHAPDCEANIGDNTFNPSNQHHPNFRCVLQAQLAGMVSNPADLTRSRTEQPTDGIRRSMVIERYRKGEATEAARGANEQASSIRDLN